MIQRASVVIFHAWWILLTPRTHFLVKFAFPIPLDTGVAQMLGNMHAAVPNLISYQGCFVLNIKPRIWYTNPPDPVIIKNWKRGNYSYSANNPEARWPHKGKEQRAGHKQLLPRSNNRKKKSVFESRLHFNHDATPNCSGRELRENGGLMLTRELLSYLKTIWTS